MTKRNIQIPENKILAYTVSVVQASSFVHGRLHFQQEQTFIIIKQHIQETMQVMHY